MIHLSSLIYTWVRFQRWVRFQYRSLPCYIAIRKIPRHNYIPKSSIHEADYPKHLGPNRIFVGCMSISLPRGRTFEVNCVLVVFLGRVVSTGSQSQIEIWTGYEVRSADFWLVPEHCHLLLLLNTPSTLTL